MSSYRSVHAGRLPVVALALLVASCASKQTLRPFSADGCSRFPDGTVYQRTLWQDCCNEHDRAYWRGGTRAERRAADRVLRQCVQNVRSTALAAVMYSGVRAGGGPWWPTAYRWGYGWRYGRGYRPLSNEEQRAADALLANPDPEEPRPTEPQ